jgi:cytochrome c oxidase assembly protein subunit 15
MFLFPVSKWVGNILFEHVHRLAASVVGLLTTILAIWLWRRDERRWMKWLGVAAFGMVVFQGVLGGLRVTLLKDQIGVFHAAIAQSFLVLVAAIALFSTNWWRGRAGRVDASPGRLGTVFLAVTGLIFVQLIVAATMRHQHAGLSIPDFPAAYGKIWPDTDEQAVARYNQMRVETNGYKPITSFQVVLQMVHRMIAVAILASVGWVAWRTRAILGSKHALSRLGMGWLVLVILQVLLGATTIWTGKSADVATAHVAIGALCLLAGSLGAIISLAPMAGVAYKVAPVTDRVRTLAPAGVAAPRQPI